MIHFREFCKNCVFKNNTLCSYWEKSTECHLLSCPFYSQKTTPKRRKALQKQLNDKVKFHPTDFDNKGSTVQDIINKEKSEVTSIATHHSTDSKKSSLMKKSISRMKCIACGELITDDKFVTIRDPSGVVIYLHSKGKCTPRHDQLKIVRARWLKVYGVGKEENEGSQVEE